MRKFYLIDYLQSHKPDNPTKGLFLLYLLLFPKNILKKQRNATGTLLIALLEWLAALGLWEKVTIKCSIERESDGLPTRSFLTEDAGTATVT